MIQKRLKGVLFLLFTFSGFSGIIYESVWTHYIKLFLGHAAYAQTLVLAIFMGGMAIGASLCGKYSLKWRSLLLGYGVIEGIIGIFALFFHYIYIKFTQTAYLDIIPYLNSSIEVQFFKWTFSALLIFPQSVLLGMTFPLLSSAIIRIFKENTGKTLAMLYFTNSIGAAIGVLASGFLLIDLVGLPGTIAIAGIINIVIAAIVIVLERIYSQDFFPETKRISLEPRKSSGFNFFLMVSLFTGMASFESRIAN